MNHTSEYTMSLWHRYFVGERRRGRKIAVSVSLCHTHTTKHKATQTIRFLAVHIYALRAMTNSLMFVVEYCMLYDCYCCCRFHQLFSCVLYRCSCVCICFCICFRLLFCWFTPEPRRQIQQKWILFLSNQSHLIGTVYFISYTNLFWT